MEVLDATIIREGFPHRVHVFASGGVVRNTPYYSLNPLFSFVYLRLIAIDH